MVMKKNNINLREEKQPSISVIVPVYNVEKYIRRCIDSILHQTYRNLEIILINDGSTDSSGEICDEYTVIDSRVKVIHQKNSGVSQARNIGLDNCTGEFVSFIDSDDYIDINLFTECYKKIKINNPDLIDWGILFFNLKGQVQRNVIHELPKNILIDRQRIVSEIIPQLVHTMPMDNLYLGSWITNKLFRKDIIVNNKIRFNPDIKLWEDGIFTIEYLKYCNNLICLDNSYYYYRDTPNSLSTKNDSNLYNYVINIYEKYRSMYSDIYDFNNRCACEYRFQLAHGIISRLLNCALKEKISYGEVKKQIIHMFENSKFCDYYTSTFHYKSFVFFIQIAVKVKLYRVAANLYIIYYKMKSKHRGK